MFNPDQSIPLYLEMSVIRSVESANPQHSERVVLGDGEHPRVGSDTAPVWWIGQPKSQVSAFTVWGE